MSATALTGKGFPARCQTSRLEGSLHGLKAGPSAHADDRDFGHGVMLPIGPAWFTVMCNAGSRTAKLGRRPETHQELTAGVRSGVRVPALCGGGGGGGFGGLGRGGFGGFDGS